MGIAENKKSFNPLGPND